MRRPLRALCGCALLLLVAFCLRPAGRGFSAPAPPNVDSGTHRWFVVAAAADGRSWRANVATRATATLDAGSAAADGKKLKAAWASWIMAMVLAHVVAFFTILVVRRLRGRAGPVAFLSGVASGVAVLLLNRRRLNLKRLRAASAETVLYALFDERTAGFFARLPEALNKLREKTGEQMQDLGLERRTVAGRASALRRLYDLSGSGERVPYSEAREAYEGEAASEADLEEAERLLAFAEAAYEGPEVIRKTCAFYGHEVLYQENVSAPGAPAHFVSFDSGRKEAVLSIRGTQTLADVLTDLLQDIDEFEVEEGRKAYAHAGFLASAGHVLDRVTPLVRDLLAPMGYDLRVTGHSLGAGTAALVTQMLLREASRWPSSPGFVRCLCFAPPPCVDSETALSSSSVTSLVCNDDCVPRMSLQNIGRLNLLAQGKDVKEVVKVGARRQDALAQCRNIPDLMVPGRVVVLHRVGDASASEEEEETKEDEAEEVEQEAKKEPASKGEQKEKEEREGGGDEGSDSEDEAPKSKPAGKWVAWLADGTLPEINYLELAPSSVAEHMAPVYREAIAAVLEAQGAKLDAAPPRAEEEFNVWLARAESGRKQPPAK